MSKQTFVDKHALHDAFLGNLLDRLVDVIVQQGDDLLKDANLSFPSRTVSTILLIGERQQISAADIAKELSQPHQLVTQRVDLLLKLGIIDRLTDPHDKRRKALVLTPKGISELTILKIRLQGADLAFKQLYKEIGCDLSGAAHQAMKALTKTTLSARVSNGEDTSNMPVKDNNPPDEDYKLWQNWLDY